LALFALGRRRQRHDAGPARVQPLRDPLDDTALARRIASLEDHDQLLLCVNDPVLELHKFRLQPQQFTEVNSPVNGRFGRQGRDFAHLLTDAGVVDFHFELFVEAVLQLRIDPALGFRPAVSGIARVCGHGAVPPQLRLLLSVALPGTRQVSSRF
jgi:hypothetical protein